MEPEIEIVLAVCHRCHRFTKAGICTGPCNMLPSHCYCAPAGGETVKR